MITLEEENSERGGKSIDSRGTEEVLSQLVLDIKALMLLADDDESRGPVGELVERNIANSNDEQIQQFVKLTQPKKKRGGGAGGHFLVAAGELILASFLIIAGLATVLPSVIGLTSPQELVNFIAQITSSLSLQTLSNPAVPALELLLAVLLLFGAFHTVRLAALNLREVGAVRRQSPPSPREV